MSSKSFDLEKFRLALNINFDRKYCEAKSFDYKFRDWSSDLIKFRLALSINLDRKYYKSKSRDTSSRISSQNEREKKSIENKEKLLIFSKKINNSLSRLTTVKTSRVRCEMVRGSNQISRVGSGVVPVSVWVFETLKPHSNRTDRFGSNRFEPERISI